MTRRRLPIARDLPLKRTAAGSDRSTTEGVMAEGLHSTAKPRSARHDRPISSKLAVSPLPTGPDRHDDRLEGVPSRRCRTAVVREQHDDRQFLPFELARQGVDSAKSGRRALRDVLERAPFGVRPAKAGDHAAAASPDR